MKTQLNEIKRMQQLAGIINEEESSEPVSIKKAFEKYDLPNIIAVLMDDGFHVDDIVNYIEVSYIEFFQNYKRLTNYIRSSKCLTITLFKWKLLFAKTV